MIKQFRIKLPKRHTKRVQEKQARYLFNPKSRKAKRYSAEEIIKYAEMYAAGHTMKEIATLCDSSFSRVANGIGKTFFGSLKKMSKFNRGRIRAGLKPKSWAAAEKTMEEIGWI